MSISFSMMNRLLEQRAAEDEDYRNQLKRNGTCTLADGRSLPDEALVDKLRSLGLKQADRDWLDHFSRKVPSAQELAIAVTEHSGLDIPDDEEDWVWIALVCLWERWFPERPNFEMIDDAMQAGYQCREQEPAKACRLWLEAWHRIQRLVQEFEFATLEEFDECFGGTQSLFNWVQEFSGELYYASDKHPAFLHDRLALCEAVLKLAAGSERDRKLLPAFERGLAECRAELGGGVVPLDEPSQGEADLDEIIAQLDKEYDRILPQEAIRAAQRCREAITSRLIELIRQASEAVRRDDRPTGDGHLYALYLLTEFRAKEALPAILEAVSLPGDGTYDLFGDAITEDLCRVLAALAADSQDVIDGLIANRALDQYVRWSAASTYLLLVRDGRMSREEAVERLGAHLAEVIANQDAKVASGLVATLDDFGPRECLAEIEQAYRQGLVDPRVIRLENIQQTIAEGDAGFQERLHHCRATGIADTVEELRGWAAFQEVRTAQKPVSETPLVGGLDGNDEPIDEEPVVSQPREVARSSATIRNVTPRVGRNDPCPCGSGRKYKKCCGR